jgi:ATP-dependent Lon protease
MVNNSSSSNNTNDALNKKIKKIEKDLKNNNNKLKSLELWKDKFNLDSKINPNNINEELPYMLLNIFNSINNLNTFKEEIEIGTEKIADMINKRSYSDSDDSDEEEIDYTKPKIDIITIFKLNSEYNILNKKDKLLVKEYISLLIDNKKMIYLSRNDLEHFIQLKEKEKKNIIKIETDIYKLTDNNTPARYKILNSNIPIDIKRKCIDKFNSFKQLEAGSGEYTKLNNWINGLIHIPWNNYINLSSKNKNFFEYLKESKETLDKSIYGQEQTKQNIIQLVSKLITNPKSVGNVFSIYGPMGTGKTTIIKDGLSKILGLPFNFISLGGASESSFLEGHSYTYEGSIPGRIVESLKQSRCMNPIFYFDELDKVSDTSKGKEIINLLIHLTDPSQNSHFNDKYYGDIPFDLSKAIFIFSFNQVELINPILKDRMNLIKVDGFNKNDKFNIFKNFLIKDIFKQYNFKVDEINISDENIKHIINTTDNKESGVRNIKRHLENIVSILNVIKLSFLDNKINKAKKIKLNKLNYENLKKILPFIKTNNKSIDTILEKIKLPMELNKDLIDLFLDISQKPDFKIPSMYT